MFDFRSHFLREGKKLYLDYTGIGEEIQHKPSKGQGREEVLREVLKVLLPPYIGVSNGEVFCTTGETSNQCDVIFHEWQTSPAVFSSKNIGIFPSECVYGVMEVKSKLDKKELIDTYGKIRLLKSFPKIAYTADSLRSNPTIIRYGKVWKYFPTLGFIFAYDSIDMRDIRETLQTLDKGVPCDQRLDAIWVLSKGTIRNRIAKDRKVYPTPWPDSERVALGLSADNSFSATMYDLLTLFRDARMPRFDFMKYHSKHSPVKILN